MSGGSDWPENARSFVKSAAISPHRFEKLRLITARHFAFP
ncbi:hypothetical protein OHAE_2151 [Ochrobactrum soli]|uniref:Uncharacterized protein n=1 Tax=Ochrobactrum soli TaxID=2448455 RepID=A0A2P9HQ77_9HYPH|nr:hypothetical protein OHAE_2151 [[Ochrobactrum] soli]